MMIHPRTCVHIPSVFSVFFVQQILSIVSSSSSNSNSYFIFVAHIQMRAIRLVHSSPVKKSNHLVFATKLWTHVRSSPTKCTKARSTGSTRSAVDHNTVVDEFRQLNEENLENSAATNAYWRNQGRPALNHPQVGL